MEKTDNKVESKLANLMFLQFQFAKQASSLYAKSNKLIRQFHQLYKEICMECKPILPQEKVKELNTRDEETQTENEVCEERKSPKQPAKEEIGTQHQPQPQLKWTESSPIRKRRKYNFNCILEKKASTQKIFDFNNLQSTSKIDEKSGIKTTTTCRSNVKADRSHCSSSQILNKLNSFLQNIVEKNKSKNKKNQLSHSPSTKPLEIIQIPKTQPFSIKQLSNSPKSHDTLDKILRKLKILTNKVDKRQRSQCSSLIVKQTFNWNLKHPLQVFSFEYFFQPQSTTADPQIQFFFHRTILAKMITH